VVDFVEGDLTDPPLARPVEMDDSLNDDLVFVDLPAPYRDEKLSACRGFRANMIAPGSVVCWVAIRTRGGWCSEQGMSCWLVMMKMTQETLH
jgi:hypothetical protein